MKIKCFEDIEAWKEARDLTKIIYDSFSHIKDLGFRDQVQRATVSVMSNIAEGFDRGGNREFIQFLTIARGSVSEVKSLCYAALDLGYLNREIVNNIFEKCGKLTNLLNGFIRYLKSSSRKS